MQDNLLVTDIKTKVQTMINVPQVPALIENIKKTTEQMIS